MDMTGYDEPYFFTHEFSSWGYGQWKDQEHSINKNHVRKLFLKHDKD